MTSYQFIKTQDDSGILYISAEFQVENVTYMAIFGEEDNKTLSIWEDDKNISDIIQNKNVYSIKFAVKEYFDNGNDDVYAPPLNHQFGKKEINLLKRHLENLVQEHYSLFKPDCYFFVAYRPSLARMYKKMCCNPSLDMADFKPIINLGNQKDCFILKTPTYDQEE